MSFSKNKADAFINKLKTVFQTKSNMVDNINEKSTEDTYPSTLATKKYLDAKMQIRDGFFKVMNNIVKRGENLVIMCYNSDGSPMPDGTHICLRFIHYHDKCKIDGENVIIEDVIEAHELTVANSRIEFEVKASPRVVGIFVAKKSNASINMSATVIIN